MNSPYERILKRISKPISPDASLSEFLSRNTKEQLLDIKRVWGFSIPSTFKKQELLEALSEKIPLSIPSWIKTVPWPSYALMSGELEMSVGDPAAANALSDLTVRGIAFLSISDDKVDFLIPKELKALIPNGKAIKKKAEHNHLKTILIQGLLNLYGVLALDDLTETLNKIILEPVTSYELGDWVENGIFMYIDGQLEFIKGERFLIHDYVDDPERIIFERPDLEMRDFSIDDLSNLCYNLTTNESQTYFDKMLDGIYSHEILDEMGLDDAINSIQLSFMNDEKTMDGIQPILDCLSFNELDDINSLIQLIMDYHNHAPKWTLKGHAPSDLFDKEISKLHKAASSKKVGRNDPCPCGSGKKYKKCCLEKDEREKITRIH